MKNFIDKTLTFIMFFIISFIVIGLFLENFNLKLLLATLCSVLLVIIISVFQKYTNKRLNYKNFEILASVKGNDYIMDKLLLALNHLNFVKQNDYLINDEKIIIFCSVKFGSISPDEILKLDKIAKQMHSCKCYLVGKELQKISTITLYNYADNFKFIPLKVVFKLLKSKKLLDKKLNYKIGKLNYSKNIFDIIFAKNNIKKFLLVSLFLFALSFIIPFKKYYIILGCLNIVFATIALIRGKSDSFNGKYEIFEKHNKD